MIAMTDTNVIERKSLHLELVERIRPLIVERQLQPGDKVPEKDLCERFGVSRTPMREALKVLAAEGLVRLEPNRGAWVTVVSVEEVEEVFPILGALEALSGELACTNITDAEISHVRWLHDQMMESYRTRNLADYFKTNQQIHGAILLAAKNQSLTNACQALSARMQRARYAANLSEERWADAVSEHVQIIQSLESRDGKQLGKVLVRHMKNKQDSVLKWLRKADAIRETSPV